MILNKIDSFFKISENNSNIKTEVLAGLTTFSTISYIAFVNPAILSVAGMDKNAVFVATILAAAFSTILMALYANWPIALAPGMGTNSWFAYGVVLGMGIPWPVALGAVFISGLLIILVTLLPIRKAIIEMIPNSFKMAIASGVGLFIILIGLRSSGIIVGNSATIVSLGDLTQPSCYLTILGLVIIILFESLKIRGSIIIAIISISIIAFFMGLSSYNGIISMPPSILPTFMQLDIKGAISMGILTIILSIFLIDFFNSTAVFIGIMGAVKDKIPDKNLKKALLVDGIGTTVGATLGVNPVVTFSESAAGVVQVGGRTGLVTLIIGLLFLCLLFFSPVLTIIPSFATASAMIYISYLMFKNIRHVDWDDVTELLPAFLTVIMMPLTASIFNGIGIGALLWVVMKVIYKKWQMKYWPMAFIGLSFIIYLTI